MIPFGEKGYPNLDFLDDLSSDTSSESLIVIPSRQVKKPPSHAKWFKNKPLLVVHSPTAIDSLEMKSWLEEIGLKSTPDISPHTKRSHRATLHFQNVQEAVDAYDFLQRVNTELIFEIHGKFKERVRRARKRSKQEKRKKVKRKRTRSRRKK